MQETNEIPYFDLSPPIPRYVDTDAGSLRDRAAIGRRPDMIFRRACAVGIDAQARLCRTPAKCAFGQGRPADIAEADEQNGGLVIHHAAILDPGPRAQ